MRTSATASPAPPVEELTRSSQRTQFVPTLVGIANAIERDADLVAEPRFLRDEQGRIRRDRGRCLMSAHAKCGRGWEVRCASSKGKKCRCQCGGANHGTSLEPSARLAGRHANYCVVTYDEREVVIRDLGPWDSHPTVTNDAEWVVSELAPKLNGRRLFYYDSGSRLDELLVASGRFVGFAPGPQEALV